MRWLIVALLLALLVGTNTAWADTEVDPEGSPYDPGVTIEGESGEEGVGVVVTGTGESWQYLWLLDCSENHPERPMVMCQGAHLCQSGDQLRWRLWSRQITDAEGQPTPDSDWVPGEASCRDDPPDSPDEPQITDGFVLSEVRRLGLPRLRVRVQPAEETLVNLETIFFAREPHWSRTVQLLGYSVDIQATAATYGWAFGDGATLDSQGPGAPYPDGDIVHEYADAHVTVRPSVDVAYEIRYRVDGGAWQAIDETVPAAGYPVDLAILEATPVLVGD